MKREDIKANIKKKFGTLSKFSRITGYNRYDLQILFAVKNPLPMELAKVNDLCRKTKAVSSDGELTPRLIKSIKSKLDDMGGLRQFCIDNPRFPEVSVYQIVDGNRRRISKQVKELCKVLNVKL